MVTGTFIAPEGGVVSSVRVKETSSHDYVSVWNRGGLSGRLVVNHGDGGAIAARLLGVSLAELHEMEEVA